MLKSGYIVKYRANPYSVFGMYLSLEDVEKYQDTKKLVISHVINHLRKNNDIGVFISKEKYEDHPRWSPLSYYSEDLCTENGGHELDIVEVYPIKMKPGFLSDQELKELVRNINPIKINQ